MENYFEPQNVGLTQTVVFITKLNCTSTLLVVNNRDQYKVNIENDSKNTKQNPNLHQP